MNLLNRVILISILFLSSCSSHTGDYSQAEDLAQAEGSFYQKDHSQPEKGHWAVYGDWAVDIAWFPEFNPLYRIFGGEPVAQVKTTNSFGNTLIIMCSGGNTGKCMPFVNLNSSCEDIGQYPALISTDSGISCVPMECFMITPMYYLFSLPEDHLDYILSGNKYGMAYGTDDGLFRAAHFSLNGSTKAFFEGQRLLEEFQSPDTEENKKSKHEDTVL